MSKSLLSLFKKDQCQWFTRESLFHSKNKERFARKKSYFSPCFLQFFTVFPLSMLKSDSLPSLFIPLLFFKELLWVNRSCLSLQKSNHEQIALVALYKRVAWANRSCCSLNCSCCSLQKSGRSLKKSRRAKERNIRFSEWIALLLFRSQRTSDSLKKPNSEFPTLLCNSVPSHSPHSPPVTP